MPTAEPADSTLAAAIRRLREQRGMSQEELAQAAKLSVGSFARIERAQANPAWTTVKRIARALGLSAAELAAQAERAGDQ